MRYDVKKLSNRGLWFFNNSLKLIIFMERLQFAFSIFRAVPAGRYHWVGHSRLRSAMLTMALFLFEESPTT